jgi:hypothetical protein
MSYLISESVMTASNARDSKELSVELHDKLTDSAIQLFKSLSAQDYYMEGGHGIEMLHLFAVTFKPRIATCNTHCLLSKSPLLFLMK